jgi:hypothetical protein
VLVRRKEIKGISRVLMSPTELKVQLTIYLQSKPGYCSALLCKCIVGCIFNSAGLIFTRELPVYKVKKLDGIARALKKSCR